MGTELFNANLATTTVSSGGTDAPSSGSSETWTVASSVMFGAAATGISQFHVADPQLPSEVIAVTNVSGTTWTVTRGAESTIPLAHSPGFTVYQVTTTGFLSKIPVAPDWLNVVTYGANPTGTNDSTSAVQGLLDDIGYIAANDASGILGAAQVTIYFPGPGPYLIDSGPLVFPHGVSLRLTGAGDGVILKSSANGIIDFGGLNGLTEGSIEIDHLGFDCTGGHVFQNANLHGQLSLHDLAIRQRSAGYSVFWMDDTVTGHTTGLYQAVFRDIRYTLDPGTRSIEAWHIVNGHGDGVTDLTWEHISGPVPTGYTGNDSTMDNTQYQWLVTNTGSSGAHVTNIAWRNCIMSSAFGGIIKAGGAQGVLIENVSAYNTYDRAISNSLYYLHADPTGGSPVEGAVIRNCTRTTGLGNGSTQPPYDILLDSTGKNVLIENYVVGYSTSVAYIDVAGAAGVVVLQPGGGGASSSPVISNQAADTIVISQGDITIGSTSLGAPDYDTAVAGYAPAAWWKLADSNGSSTAADSSGNGWTGTATSVTFGETPGPISSISADTAALFGSSSSIATSFNPSGITQFTMGAWVNMGGLTPSSSYYLVANDAPSSSNNGIQWRLFYNGTGWVSDLIVGNGSAHTTSDSSSTISTTGWVFLTVTFTNTGSAIHNYINGAPINNGGSLSGTVSAGAGGMGLGYNPQAAGSHFTKEMAQVFFISGTVLNSAQILALYNDGIAAIVNSVTAGDTSIVVGGTAAAPTIETGTLDVIATDHPAAASWSNNNQGITSLALAGVSGSAGATAGCRFVGAIASGTAPASGTFETGDVIIVLTGSIIICTAGGTQGTWAVA